MSNYHYFGKDILIILNYACDFKMNILIINYACDINIKIKVKTIKKP